MTQVIILIVVAVLVGWRLWRRSRGGPSGRAALTAMTRGLSQRFGTVAGDAGLVAGREIRERIKGRVFRVGTALILLAVAAAVVIPAIRSKSTSSQSVCVVGDLPAQSRQIIVAAAGRVGTTVEFVPQPSVAAAQAAVRSGHADFCVIDGGQLLVNTAIGATDTSTTANLVRVVSVALGAQAAYQAAGLSPAQAEQLAQAKPLPVESLHPGAKTAGRTTSVIGVILIFIMLTQYNTWILMGVMQEKSSRVVEVLLAAIRPIQLLAGKVLGIGLVAMGQAALIVVVALVLAKAVGSDLLHGTAPLELASALLWLVLGYAFYCWVYAAAGSTAERQDQVQTLAFPLSLPILFGYITALTVAGSGHVSLLFKVLAYLPPTAPFAMPVLVGLGKVTWWQFLASVVLSVIGTVLVARFAARVYRRAILRTGRRVRLREVLYGN
jgi:ABC-2 type transport system permease protein